MKIESALVVCLSVAAVSQISVQADDVNALMSNWNVVTVNNAQINNEYEGRAFVGGNLTADNQAAIGHSLSSTNISLAVAGNITANNYINVQNGSVVVGGTSSAHFNMNGGGTVSLGSSVPAAISPVSTLISSSLYWSTLAANSTITTNGANQINFNSVANGSGLAVFNVTGAQTFNAGLNGFNLNLGSGVTTVLVNVNAGSVNWNNGGFFGNFQTDFGRGNVVYNFYNATNIYLGNQVEGYIVAPNANVTLGNNVDGGVVASNLVAGSEIHLPDRNASASAFYGSLPNALSPGSVPEPATLALLPVGAALWACRRRRGNK